MKQGTRNISIQKIPFWILIPAILFVVNLIIGFNGLYGQDSFEYLRYSRALHQYLSGGPLPANFYWPILYPLSGALLSFLMPDIFALQLVSIASFGLSFYFLRNILFALIPERKKESVLYLLLFFSASPFVLRSASSAMSDSLAMFFISAFFYYWLMFTKNYSNRHFLLLVFFAFAAVNTRYSSAAVLLIPAVHALTGFIRKFDTLTFFLSLMVIATVFLTNILLEINGSPGFRGPLHWPAWSFTDYFHRSFFTADGHQSYTFPNIIFVFSNLFHPGYIFPGLLFFLLIRKERIQKQFPTMMIIVILLYSLFLAGFTTQNLRFLLLTFPCVILIYAGSFFRIHDNVKSQSGILIFTSVTFVIIIQVLLCCRAFKPFYEDCRRVREISSNLKSYPGKTIYTFNIDMGLRAYNVQNEIINIWEKDIKIFRPGSLILFNYVTSYRQWKGLNPMNNWKRVKEGHHLLLREHYSGGWNLYEITD